jgi:hypothetical protein
VVPRIAWLYPPPRPDSAGENGVSGAEMCGRGIVERYRLGFPLQSEWGPWIGTGTFHEAPVMESGLAGFGGHRLGQLSRRGHDSLLDKRLMRDERSVGRAPR